MNPHESEVAETLDDQAEQFAEFDQLIAAGESPADVPDALRADVELLRQLRKKWSAGGRSDPNATNCRSEWTPGHVVNGYRIIRLCGKGNGQTYEAVKGSDKPVALKRVFLDSDVGRADQKSLNIWKSIKNQAHLVYISESWLILEANELGIVMELGVSLDQHIGKLEQKVLLKYMEDAASGLDYLHKNNLIHQDVKPSNLFVFGDTVKVGDYSGLRPLKNIEADDESNNFPVSTCIRTRGYNDHDHFNGRPSFKSDQYSLAITYLELRTGKGSSSQDLTHLEPAEAAVVTKALSKSPKYRFECCLDFVRALKECFENPVSVPTSLSNRPAPIVNTCSRRSALMPVAMVLMLAAAFIGGGALLSGVFASNGVATVPELPDFSGEWDYVCTAQTKAYQHGGTCTMRAEPSKDGTKFTIIGQRLWERIDGADRRKYKTAIDWTNTWGIVSNNNEVRFEYLVQLPDKKGNVVGYARGNVTFEDEKPVRLHGTFNQGATNDPLFGSMVFTKRN